MSEQPLPLPLPLPPSPPTLLVEFSVPGEPTSKARARFGKGGRSYTPATTRAAEEVVAAVFRQALPGHVPSSTDAFRVEAEFRCGSRQRRDVDNMAKLIFDSLNEVAWGDDAQVLELHASKRFVDPGDRVGTTVRVYVIGDLDRRTSKCEYCGGDYLTYASWVGRRRFCAPECREAERRERRGQGCLTCGAFFFPENAGGKWCTRACWQEYKTVGLNCLTCGAAMRKPRSTANKGKPFCCDEHRDEYWRTHRVKTAMGSCARCGGPTSKKSYTHCQGCATQVARGKRGAAPG